MNLRSTERKLRRLLTSFQFGRLRDVIALANLAATPAQALETVN